MQWLDAATQGHAMMPPVPLPLLAAMVAGTCSDDDCGHWCGGSGGCGHYEGDHKADNQSTSYKAVPGEGANLTGSIYVAV